MRFSKSFQWFLFFHFEWLALVTGLVLMAGINPYQDGFSFCIYEMIGVPYCPGEGFGRSIALFFRGEIAASFQMHPFGIPAIIVITHRIISIFKRNRSITQIL